MSISAIQQPEQQRPALRLASPPRTDAPRDPVRIPRVSADRDRPDHDSRVVPHPSRYLDRTAFDTSTETDVPAPSAAVIQKLALYAFEVIEGSRAVAQLGGWITHGVAAALRERRAIGTERRTLYRDSRRVVACPGPAHLDRPMPHIVEATVVLYAEPRSRSVLLRFEHSGGRWRATDLTVL
ncbi:MAG: Rv3235 family protein [Leucobacter sp.]